MMGQFAYRRTFVFIDAANILYSQRTLGWFVDYRKLKEYLELEMDLRKIYFYTGHVGDNAKQTKFLEKLAGLGYIIRKKELKRIRVSRHEYVFKGNLDAELVIDALKNLQYFDTCILMSGDSDFAPLLDELKDSGKRVLVVSSKDHVARELLMRAKYINLNKLKDQLSYKKNPPQRAGEV